MRSWFGIFLVFAFLGIGWNVYADVNGDITLQIGMFPLATQTESVEFIVDFEILSNINWTISGLNIGSRTALGVTGLEHSIITIDTALGALDILSESVFATPFSNNIPDDIDGDGIPNVSDDDIDGDGIANLADPTPFGTFQGFIRQDIDGDGVDNNVDPDIDGDGILNAVDTTPFGTNFVVTPLTRPIGPMLFVKKRLTSSINLAGFTITNLAIFEDIEFTHPFPSTVQTYSEDVQDFRFGNIITILGQTVSGINIRSVTGIGADPNVPNLIKKASFQGSICPSVTPNVQTPSNRAFAFCVEQLFIDNVEIGSLKLNSRTEFRILPLTFSQTLTLQHGFFDDLVNVTASFTTDNIIALTPLSTSIFINSAPLTVSLNLDSTLAITSSTATLSANIDGAVLTVTATFLPVTGINSLNFRFQTISLSGLSLFASTVLSNPGGAPNGGFGSHSTTFTLTGQLTPAFGINSSMTFTNEGVTSINAQLIFKF